jgi:prefoldin alpha subunit
MDSEQIMKFQVLQEEAQKLSQQNQLIEQNISEIIEIESSLDELEKNESNELLANLGKKIYIPVEIKEKFLIVEIGNKNYVKKSFSDTKEIISEQLMKLNFAKDQIDQRLEVLQKEAELLMLDIEKEQNKRETKIKKHSHEKDCKNDVCDCKDHHN